jgi:manganese/iron transport system ATP-binding protein
MQDCAVIPDSRSANDAGAVYGRKVSVVAGGRAVLRECDFSFPVGRFACILGPNGAGKTTLLHLCNGLTSPSAGEVVSLGARVTPRSAPALRKRIGYVAQWREMDPRRPISVFESVLSGTYGKLGLFRKPGPVERALAAEALEKVAASHLAQRPLGHLSGGEAQRTSIARALAQQPELLLLDEPTASLDWQARRDILRLIADLKQTQALTIVMVIHELNALPELCDTALFLKAGQVLWQGSCAEALNSERLSALFDTPVEIIERAGKPIVLL